jgi:hypothetical protein
LLKKQNEQVKKNANILKKKLDCEQMKSNHHFVDSIRNGDNNNNDDNSKMTTSGKQPGGEQELARER